MPKLRRGKSHGARGQMAKGLATEIAVLKLHVQRRTLQEIGDEIGISKQGAHQALARALTRAVEERADLADKALEAELLALDALQIAFWDAAMGGDVDAADRVFKALAARAKLLGLNAPVKVDGNVTGLADILAAVATSAGRGDVAPSVDVRPGSVLSRRSVSDALAEAGGDPPGSGDE